MKFTDLDSKRKRLLVVQSVATCLLLTLAQKAYKDKTEAEILAICTFKAEGFTKLISDEQINLWLQHLDLESSLVNIMNLKQ